MIPQALLPRLSKATQPVIVDVWAPWCIPCRRMEPVIDRLQEMYASRVEVWKVNADVQAELVKELGVYGIPTLIGFIGGRELFRRTGLQTEEELAALFEASLQGHIPSPQVVRRADRLLRGSAGLALLAIGWLSGLTWPFFLLGGAVLFSAVYDRCPLWQMTSTRVKALLDRGRA